MQFANIYSANMYLAPFHQILHLPIFCLIWYVYMGQSLGKPTISVQFVF